MVKKHSKRFMAIFLTLVMVVGLLPAMTIRASAEGTTGTADGTYDFGGLGNTSDGGYYALGDKFKVGNDAETATYSACNGVLGGSNTAFYPTDSAASAIAEYTENAYKIVIKAEGGAKCKTFTFRDLGISAYHSGVDYHYKFATLNLTLKDASGNSLYNQDFTNSNEISQNSVSQLSTVTGHAVWDIANVTSIEMTFFLNDNAITGAGNLAFENINIANVSNTINTAPTDIALSASAINENVASNSTVGTLSSTDTDVGNTFTYTLVSGTGSTDNASFNISGNSLRVTNSPDYEAKNSYTVRVRTTDQGGLTYEKAFAITINDLNEAPTVTTQAVSSIASTTATGNGNITDLGSSNPTQYGVVWDTSTGPTTALDTKTEHGDTTSTGAFTSSITGLTPGTTYHVRAYATNAVDTAYGSEVTFTTAGAPTITGISPTSGPTAGATSVTITGTNFIGASAVKFGIANATGYTINSATQITATTPAGSVGTVDVTVTAAGSTSATSSADQYTYVAAPTVTGLSRTDGPTVGGDSVIITGTNLTGATAVSFGGTAASSYTVNSANQITATTPAHAAGTVDITVTTAGGTSAASSADHFLYAAVPSITTVNPDKGPLGGGTNITITGSNFVGSSTVTVGGTSATEVALINGSTITAKTPAGTAGAKNVVVTTAFGSATAGGFFTYVAAPTATTGAASGVTATGANLSGTVNAAGDSTTVTFEYGMNSSYGTAVTATPSPATGSGATAVSVAISGLAPNTTYHYRVVGVSSGGRTNGSDLTFTTVAIAPTVATNAASSLNATGATLNGTVNANNSSTTVTFEYGLTMGYGTPISATPGTVTGLTGTSVSKAITGLDPNTTYHYRVVGVNSAGTSNGSDQSFHTSILQPTVTSISPLSGPIGGGTTVTITGTNLSGATAVSFGGTAATGYTVNSATQITATAPAGSAGTVDVTVTTAGGTSATGSSDQFTYTAAPTITGISPNSGTMSGGTSVTITGTNLSGASAVRFDGTAATGYTVNSATQITATAPAGAEGTVDITVTTVGGTSATGTSDQFTYVAAPTITSLSPANGPALGGTSVTITGTKLSGASAVSFGGTAATSYTVNSATEITAIAPTGSAGAVHVTITTAGGTSATSSSDQYTYNVVIPDAPTIPGAPTIGIATAGNSQASVSFTAPASTGGASITGYTVTASPGGLTGIGTTSPITVSGLTGGTSYTFTVTATNSAGVGPASGSSNAVTPTASVSSGGGGGGSTPATNPSTPATTQVLVNGQPQNAGTTTTTTVGNQSTTTVAVDESKIEAKLKSEGMGSTVVIPVNTGSDVVIGQLNGQTIKSMEAKEATLEINTGTVSYTLPASEINIDNVSQQIGSLVALKDITISVKISDSSAGTAQIIADTANKNSYQLVVKPIEFSISCTSGGKTVDVSKFNGYVERTIAIPSGVDPSKITTGIVLNSDGTFSHVPTTIVVINGKYYAKINSLTNSTYSVIWNQKTFKDVENHWAKEAVNDMASRLIISGVDADTFAPDREITRAEFASIIVKGLGLMRTGTGKDAYNDVAKSDWYYDAVSIASQYNIVSGFGEGTFGPNEKITREQAMTMVSRAMKITGLKADATTDNTDQLLASFKDSIELADYAKESAIDCSKAGIISGKSSSEIAPKANITRGEVAAIVQRLLKKSKLI